MCFCCIIDQYVNNINKVIIISVESVGGLFSRAVPSQEARDVLALGALKVAKVAVYALSAIAAAAVIVLSIKMPLLSIVLLPVGLYSIKTAAEKALNWIEKKESDLAKKTSIDKGSSEAAESFLSIENASEGEISNANEIMGKPLSQIFVSDDGAFEIAITLNDQRSRLELTKVTRKIEFFEEILKVKKNSVKEKSRFLESEVQEFFKREGITTDQIVNVEIRSVEVGSDSFI